MANGFYFVRGNSRQAEKSIKANRRPGGKKTTKKNMLIGFSRVTYNSDDELVFDCLRVCVSRVLYVIQIGTECFKCFQLRWLLMAIG